MANWFYKDAKAIWWEEENFSTNGAWTTGLSKWEKVMSILSSHYMHKLWNIKAKILKLLEENIRACLCDSGKSKISWRGHRMHQPQNKTSILKDGCASYAR